LLAPLLGISFDPKLCCLNCAAGVRRFAKREDPTR
jgi:hypothetical protein